MIGYLIYRICRAMESGLILAMAFIALSRLIALNGFTLPLWPLYLLVLSVAIVEVIITSTTAFDAREWQSKQTSTVVIESISPGRAMLDWGGLIAVLCLCGYFSPLAVLDGSIALAAVSLTFARIASTILRVEIVGATAQFRTCLGGFGLPLSGFRNVVYSSGGQYYVKFQYRLGTIPVLNPKYPHASTSYRNEALDRMLEIPLCRTEEASNE